MVADKIIEPQGIAMEMWNYNEMLASGPYAVASSTRTRRH
jgi:hypothetical protein